MKNQNNFISLNDFKKIIFKTFSLTSFVSEFVANTNQTIINFSSQYHNCSQCVVAFSSLLRLLQHVKKNDCIKITCKHCEEKFNSNNKFHEHVRQHHNQKNFVTFVQKIEMKSNAFITFSITFRSTSAIFKHSFHSIIMMKTSMICSFLSSSISSRTSILSHQEKHITSKIYMTMNDLFIMFAKKQFKKNLNIIHKKYVFRCLFKLINQI